MLYLDDDDDDDDDDDRFRVDWIFLQADGIL